MPCNHKTLMAVVFFPIWHIQIFNPIPIAGFSSWFNQIFGRCHTNMRLRERTKSFISRVAAKVRDFFNVHHGTHNPDVVAKQHKNVNDVSSSHLPVSSLSWFLHFLCIKRETVEGLSKHGLCGKIFASGVCRQRIVTTHWDSLQDTVFRWKNLRVKEYPFTHSDIAAFQTVLERQFQSLLEVNWYTVWFLRFFDGCRSTQNAGFPEHRDEGFQGRYGSFIPAAKYNVVRSTCKFILWVIIDVHTAIALMRDFVYSCRHCSVV